MHESITRHPDMPEGLFKAMEKIVSQKKIWRGYVKELSRDGRYYWVLMYVQAKLDENDEIVGSISTRKKAYTSSAQEAQEAYEKRRGEAFIDDPYFMRTELFLGDSIASRG
jgi:aerotaxis receptor